MMLERARLVGGGSLACHSFSLFHQPSRKESKNRRRTKVEAALAIMTSVRIEAAMPANRDASVISLTVGYFH